MPILVVDVGGTSVKLYLSETGVRTQFSSGPTLTPEDLVFGVKTHTSGWAYDRVTLGIPSPVVRDRVMEEPWNLGPGWVGFEFAAAFGVPVKLVNDAAMQALGSYEGGRMLFLGLGYGLGTALVHEGGVVPLELGHLPFRDKTFEDYCGQRGLEQLGEPTWRSAVLEAIALLRSAVAAEYVMLGGGNVHRFAELPPHIRRGDNDRACEGGIRIWSEAPAARLRSPVLSEPASAGQAPVTPDLRELFSSDPARAQRYSLTVGELHVDCSKNFITPEIMEALYARAREAGVEAERDRMFAGEKVNVTENRAALHVALRNRSARPMRVDGRDVMPDVRAALDHVRRFSEAVRNGEWRGYAGLRITDVVNIGIGGSDLGPAMAVEALKPYAREGPRVHFVSNLDGTQLDDTLRDLHPSTTLFIVASKTFTTLETMTNARSARAWFLARAIEERRIARHFVAASTNEAEVRAFGIAPENMFVFWDWVGGRYSVWSSIGLPIAVAVGYGHFEQMLDGAFEMDEHFRTAPLERNLPITLGLLGYWYASVLGADTCAILPYEQYLHRLPAYLQQLEMESNGKRVQRDGRPVATHTAPVVWGGPGTNGQHAFFQLLHQGTRLVPCDFLVGTRSHTPGEHHRLLMANCLAQAEALMRGRTEAEVRAELAAEGLSGEALERLVPHKVLPGNRPSTTIMYGRLGPRTLGMLLAMYEHKVFTMAALWHINPFDQFGVEIGKRLAVRVAEDLAAKAQATDPPGAHDSSTAALIARAKHR